MSYPDPNTIYLCHSCGERIKGRTQCAACDDWHSKHGWKVAREALPPSKLEYEDD